MTKKLKTSPKTTLSHVARRAYRYRIVLFLLFLTLIYGFLSWRVIALEQVEPDQAAVSSKLQTAGVPHIDEDVISKMQQLQDNSVSVQALFDQARSNPFQE